MAAVYNFLKTNKISIYNTVLYIITVSAIVWSLPAERKFMYEFQKNKPWKHEALFAPFDFPIHKTEKEISQERDSLEKAAKPYFTFNSGIGQAAVLNFEEKALSALEKTGIIGLDWAPAVKKASQKLSALMDRGIVSDQEHISYSYGRPVVIIKGKYATESQIADIYSLSGAKALMQAFADSLVKGVPTHELLAIQAARPADYLQINVALDAEKTDIVKSGLLASMSMTRGMVQQGEKIISPGDIVRDKEFMLLKSFKEEYESTKVHASDRYAILFGQTVLAAIAIFVLGLFILYAQPQILKNPRHSAFIALMVCLFVVMGGLVASVNHLSLYMLPFAMLPIIIKTFFNARIALFVHVITILALGFIAPNSFEFVFMQIIVGAIALYTLGDTYKRSYLFFASLIAFASYSVIYFGIGILHEARLSSVDWGQFIWFGASSLLVLTAQPLIYAFEKTFGFLSDATLVELSYTNHPLLRQLADSAPGTFQHSLQVANLSEAAAKAIGGNSLLARVGCLYHDIGKSLNPAYFTENQLGRTNPHDSLPPEESAGIIINHIIEGEKLARKHKLPEAIIGIITGHHGSSKVNYFLRTARNSKTASGIDESKYQYPYKSPATKEQAVVMMADALEAAARSLPEINETSLRNLIDDIIGFQISEKQFRYADITFMDIEKVKESFLKSLLNMHHVRIAYPADNSKKDNE
jgi:cyclic-di-AMP phosphodiesterase PgpH